MDDGSDELSKAISSGELRITIQAIPAASTKEVDVNIKSCNVLRGQLAKIMSWISERKVSSVANGVIFLFREPNDKERARIEAAEDMGCRKETAEQSDLVSLLVLGECRTEVGIREDTFWSVTVLPLVLGRRAGGWGFLAALVDRAAPQLEEKQ